MSKSSIITDEIPNPTPGEVLLLDFIEPMGLTQNSLARAIRVPPRRINEIVLGKRAVTADTDLRLARYFGLSDGFWLGLQSDHDLLRQRQKIAAELERIDLPPRGEIMSTASDRAEFQRGWDAALAAVRAWHEAKAKQAMVTSTRSRFPKNFEREAEFHRQSAEIIVTLSPDDV
jgi:addiction module HigA family antidote